MMILALLMISSALASSQGAIEAPGEELEEKTKDRCGDSQWGDSQNSLNGISTCNDEAADLAKNIIPDGENQYEKLTCIKEDRADRFECGQIKSRLTRIEAAYNKLAPKLELARKFTNINDPKLNKTTRSIVDKLQKALWKHVKSLKSIQKTLKNTTFHKVKNDRKVLLDKFSEAIYCCQTLKKKLSNGAERATSHQGNHTRTHKRRGRNYGWKLDGSSSNSRTMKKFAKMCAEELTKLKNSSLVESLAVRKVGPKTPKEMDMRQLRYQKKNCDEIVSACIKFEDKWKKHVHNPWVKTQLDNARSFERSVNRLVIRIDAEVNERWNKLNLEMKKCFDQIPGKAGERKIKNMRGKDLEKLADFCTKNVAKRNIGGSVRESKCEAFLEYWDKRNNHIVKDQWKAADAFFRWTKKVAKNVAKELKKRNKRKAKNEAKSTAAIENLCLTAEQKAEQKRMYSKYEKIQRQRQPQRRVAPPPSYANLPDNINAATFLEAAEKTANEDFNALFDASGKGTRRGFLDKWQQRARELDSDVIKNLCKNLLPDQ